MKADGENDQVHFNCPFSWCVGEARVIKLAYTSTSHGGVERALDSASGATKSVKTCDTT